MTITFRKLPVVLSEFPIPQQIVGRPVQLTPIPWGEPDPVLGKMVCQHIEDTTPAIHIPFNPLCDQQVRRKLRSYSILHF